MLVYTPHNTPQIRGDSHNNFEDLSIWARDIRKTKFDLLGFFDEHILVNTNIITCC
jgi:hypothetical protein